MAEESHDDTELDEHFENFMNESLTTSNDDSKIPGNVANEMKPESPNKLWWMQNSDELNRAQQPDGKSFLKLSLTDVNDSRMKTGLHSDGGHMHDTPTSSQDKENVVGDKSQVDQTLQEVSFTSDVIVTHVDATTVSHSEAPEHSGSNTISYSEDFDESQPASDGSTHIAKSNSDGHTILGSGSSSSQLASLSMDQSLHKETKNTEPLEISKGVENQPQAVHPSIVTQLLRLTERAAPDGGLSENTSPMNVRSVAEILKEAEALERKLATEGAHKQPTLVDKQELLDEDGGHEVCVVSAAGESDRDLVDGRRALQKDGHKHKLSAEIPLSIDAHFKLERGKIDYEEHIFRLQQENVHLSAKCEELEERSKGRDVEHTKGPSTEDARWKKRYELQIREQERLIVGYQQENERLCKEVKDSQNVTKDVRVTANQEIQRLNQELNKLKNDLGNRDMLLKDNKSSPTPVPKNVTTQMRKLDCDKSEKLAADHSDNVPPISCQVSHLKHRSAVMVNTITDKNVDRKLLFGMVQAKERRIAHLENEVQQLQQLLIVHYPRGFSLPLLSYDHLSEGNVQRPEEQDPFSAKAAKDQKGTFTRSTFREPKSVSALEKQLDSLRERHRREVENLKLEVDALRREARCRSGSKDSDRVASLSSRISVLVSESREKDQKISELTVKIVALQSMVPSKENFGDDLVKKLSGELKSVRDERDTLKLQAEESRKAIRENETKAHDLISVHHAQSVQLESQLQQMTTKCLTLRSKCEALEITIENLNAQLSRSLMEKDKVVNVQQENKSLKAYCRQLQEKLCSVEASQNPQQRNFVDLQARVMEVERMYQEKSRELQQFVGNRNLQQPATGISQEEMSEVNRWKNKFYARNHELEHFRNELDTMLLTLEDLQTRIGKPGS